MEDKENNFQIGIKSPVFDKKSWEAFLPDFICKCANQARENKFWTFGIQNYSMYANITSLSPFYAFKSSKVYAKEVKLFI